MPKATTDEAGTKRKNIVEVVSYALSHRTRVHILIVLNEGTFTPGQIADIIDVPLNNVAKHVRLLVEAGSIELVKTEMVRNARLHWYRAVEIPFYSDEEIAAMTPQQREVSAGLVVQSALAEVLAALSAGKLSDPRVWLAWDWFNVDEQGRQDIADEEARSWERKREIEVESTNRRAESGEESTSMLCTQLAYERARKGPTPSPRSPNGE